LNVPSENRPCISPETNRRIERKNKIATVASWGTIGIACLGILGYLPGFHILGRIRPDYIPMAPSTAICFILLGGILLAMLRTELSGRIRQFACMFSLGITLFSLLELAGLGLNRDLNFEDALIPNLGYLRGIPIARMSPATAIVFLISGMATFALLSNQQYEGKRQQLLLNLGCGLGAAVIGTSIVFCFAYWIGSPFMYGRGTMIPMALSTAIAFLLIGMAIVGAAGKTSLLAKLLSRSQRVNWAMNAHSRFVFLAMIMISACALVLAVVTAMLYRHELREQRELLQVTAQSQARLIESIATNEIELAQHLSEIEPGYDPTARAIGQIIDAHEKYTGFGETGEFTLARQDEDEIIFILRHRHGDVDQPRPVEFESELAEPMRRALNGISGTVIDLDYRGEMVLAAHEPVAILNLGIVAKIDLAEIRQPFIRTGSAATAVALLVVLAGTVLFFWIGNPILRRLESYSHELEKEVAERRLIEETLRENEEKYRAVFEQAPDSVLLIDCETKEIVEFNDQTHLVLGYTREEFSRLRISDIDVNESPKNVTAHVEQIRGDGHSRFETRHRTKDGQLLDVSVTSRVFSLNGRELLASIWTDTTDRLKVARERERLMHAIEQANDSIVITDVDGIIQYINPTFEKVTGYSRAEALGKTPRILNSGTHEAANFEEMWNLISSGGTWSGRLVNRSKNGTLFTEDAVISPVRDDAGRIINYVAVKRDVTESIKLEEQFNQIQKVESIGRLAGGVAHDLNNMLTPILGYSELLSEDLETEDNRLDYVEGIISAGSRARDLVRQLLAFSRKQTLVYKSIDLREVIENFEGLLRRTIPEDIEIQIKHSTNSMLIKADIGQIEQVLMNLTVNAADAMQGGGTLTIETAQVDLDSDFAAKHQEFPSGSYMLLAVSDNGCGIDNDTHQHLFEPFYSTKGAQGTGLGLATVYGIVKQHDGNVLVESELGKGTKFKVYLPISEGFQSQAKPAKATTNSLRGDETVLVVEDNDQVRKLTSTILERHGYQVYTANSGPVALSLLEERDTPIDMLLTDVVMPEMNGSELFALASKKQPELQVLYMSGYTADVIGHRGVIDEGTAFIQKPFNGNDLISKIQEILEAA
jgi:PAS domain S-box-containing protein